MKPLGVSQNRLARDIDVPPARVNETGLQVDYDLRRAKRDTWPKAEKRIRPIEAA